MEKHEKLGIWHVMMLWTNINVNRGRPLTKVLLCYNFFEKTLLCVLLIIVELWYCRLHNNSNAPEKTASTWWLRYPLHVALNEFLWSCFLSPNANVILLNEWMSVMVIWRTQVGCLMKCLRELPCHYTRQAEGREQGRCKDCCSIS